MKFNLILPVAEKIVAYFWQSKQVKEFVVQLLERYAKSTDNEIDNVVVDLVRKKLLV